MAGGGARLIGLDWGTSQLRAFLLGEGGIVLEEKEGGPGVLRVPPGGFGAAFAEVTAGWRARFPEAPALASGMVGSTVGWLDVPYAPCPARLEDLVARLVRAPDGPFVVPGVAFHGDPPNVMRGEETQVVGALALMPGFAERAQLILPGTHSKWLRLDDGTIGGFETFMTGELFAVLREHSILGRPAQGAEPASGADAEEAFAAGVRAAWADGSASRLLFSTRALVLARRLTPAASLDYLSGLLIGAELARGRAGGEVLLVGAPALCERYARALALCAAGEFRTLDATEATAAGLWRVAAAAGLI